MSQAILVSRLGTVVLAGSLALLGAACQGSSAGVARPPDLKAPPAAEWVRVSTRSEVEGVLPGMYEPAGGPFPFVVTAGVFNFFILADGDRTYFSTQSEDGPGSRPGRVVDVGRWRFDDGFVYFESARPAGDRGTPPKVELLRLDTPAGPMLRLSAPRAGRNAPGQPAPNEWIRFDRGLGDRLADPQQRQHYLSGQYEALSAGGATVTGQAAFYLGHGQYKSRENAPVRIESQRIEISADSRTLRFARPARIVVGESVFDAPGGLVHHPVTGRIEGPVIREIELRPGSN